MTEAEWLASEDPAAMLAYLSVGSPARHRSASDRKLRLYYMACHHAWQDDHKRRLMGDRCGDGDAYAFIDGKAAPPPVASGRTRWELYSAPAARLAVVGAPCTPETPTVVSKTHILRDLLGNPWRPVTLPPGPKCWACQGYGTLLGSAGDRCNPTCDVCEGAGHKPSPWLTQDVVRLATAAYDERLEDGTLDPGCLLALSDALEEAGCVGELLAHLRDPGPHYRGCWAVDLILGES